MALEMKDTQVKRPRMEFADNGLIVSYELYSKRSDGGSYDGFSYECDKKLVFPFKEKDKALEMFIKLGKESGMVPADSEED